MIAFYIDNDDTIKKICKSRLPFSLRRCPNPYVKFLVEYPSGVKDYTLKMDAKYAGWVNVDKTLRFDKAPKGTTVQIQIWNHKEGKKKDEQLYQDIRTIERMPKKMTYQKFDEMSSHFQLSMISIWRDNFSYENLPFEVKLNIK